MAANGDFQAALDEISLQCRLDPYMLRAEPGMIARLTPRPEVRAGPPAADAVACARRAVARINGARLLVGSEK
jgi:hypothetical protein